MDPATARAPRGSLTRDRVVSEAVRLADESGVSSLTMRSLADRLAVKPMAIYHYTAGKEELLDAMIDGVFAEMVLPAPGGDWQERLADRSRSMRAALSRHPWALALMETRVTPGPATLAHHEAVLEVLRSAGFDVAATAHAYAILDAFVYGFALQEAMLGSIDLEGSAPEITAGLDMRDAPRMAELAAEHVMRPGYAFGESFEVGLRMVLAGIATLTTAAEV